MSQRSLRGAGHLRLAVPMAPRDPSDEERAATPLELFFDLVFVVAVALAASHLHHGLIEGRISESLIGYGLVFFGIWWAWVNFTWFASAYDNDDVAFRIFVFVTMTGALIFASGTPRIFDERDFGIAVFGYVVMRIALVTQWLRAARADPSRRITARRYAFGVASLQVGWVTSVFLPGGWWIGAWAVLAPAELLLPVWAERASPTTWHPHHIAERYGLFMIIVLGESVLAATLALQSVTNGGGLTWKLFQIVVGGLLILFSTWWIYFDRPDEERLLSSIRTVFVWGYGHLLVFASVAALGAGLAVAVDGAAGHTELGRAGRGAAIAIPVAIYLLSIWGLHVRAGDAPVRKFGVPITALLVLASSFTPAPVLLTGMWMSILVAMKVGTRMRSERPVPA